MNPLSRLAVILLLGLLLAAVLSPWVYLAVQWAATHWDGGGWDYLARHPFTRYFNRVFQISLVVGIGLEIGREMRRGRKFPMERFGLGGRFAPRQPLGGAGWSLGVMIAFALLAGGMGWQRWRMGLVASDEIRRTLGILLTAGGVSVAEEVFFRGYFYSISRDSLGRARAIWLNVLFFASIHAIRPVTGFAVQTVDWKSGFALGSLFVRQFADPNLFGGLLVLAAVAWFLCWTVERTGAVYLAMGLHAGWIVALKENFAFTLPAVNWPVWVLGGGDLSQGVVTLAAIGLQFLLVRWWLDRRP